MGEQRVRTAAGIVDVARRAGVSVSTVSRSLRGEGQRYLVLHNVGDPAACDWFFSSLPMRRRVDAVLALAASLTDAERAAPREPARAPIRSASPCESRAASAALRTTPTRGAPVEPGARH